MRYHHIHLFGASGSGTTSIAKRASELLQFVHFDSDHYFWLPTEEPFAVERPREECYSLMEKDFSSHQNWILSGSVIGWGEELTPLFDLAIFVYVPAEIRLERLRKREFERYGDAMMPGGLYYEKSQKFLSWAADYDGKPKNGRSLAKHQEWMKTLPCPILEIVNLNFEESVQAVIHAVQSSTSI
ncbi:AAA family ATPase [Scatolibacter rhodanostii]|uniref:AAA family ATPase n=1 Tax=Scatolibacter rhodanostii TaxID=2014781 RepID=UPI000C07F60A|nr:AAA family ATPase [Scatolibacter rhodanostii]